jgi:two-component system response regulator YesN
MGSTFIEYVSRLRMERAKLLLHDSNLKTYEAAEKVGFNDPQYFSSCFKKYTGMTPSDYKAQFAGMKEINT